MTDTWTGSSIETAIRSIILLLAPRSPIILIALAGVVLSLVNWRKLTSMGRLALPGCGLLLFNALVIGVCWALLPQWLADRGWDSGRMRATFTMLSLFSSMLEAMGIACLVAAIFYGRPGAVR